MKKNTKIRIGITIFVTLWTFIVSLLPLNIWIASIITTPLITWVIMEVNEIQ